MLERVGPSRFSWATVDWDRPLWKGIDSEDNGKSYVLKERKVLLLYI
jgi:hypothetical protein